MATFTALSLCPFSNLPKTPPVFPKTPTFFLKPVQNPRNTPFFSTFREIATTCYNTPIYTNINPILCNNFVTTLLHHYKITQNNIRKVYRLVND